MAKKLAGLDFTSHVNLGAELFDMKTRLQKLTIELSRSYGVTSKQYKQAEKALTAIGNLRSALDDVVGLAAPDRTNLELNRVYYPGHD